MKMSGEYTLNAGREAVWQALNDPEVLKASIPGCESIVMLSETEMEAVAVAKVGPVKAKFKGKVQLSDLDPPNGYTISGEGSGGAAGFRQGRRQGGACRCRGRRHGAVLRCRCQRRRQACPDRPAPDRRRGQEDGGSFFSSFAEQVGGTVAADERGHRRRRGLSDEVQERSETERSRSKLLIYGGLALIARARALCSVQ